MVKRYRRLTDDERKNLVILIHREGYIELFIEFSDEYEDFLQLSAKTVDLYMN